MKNQNLNDSCYPKSFKPGYGTTFCGTTEDDEVEVFRGRVLWELEGVSDRNRMVRGYTGFLLGRLNQE